MAQFSGTMFRSLVTSFQFSDFFFYLNISWGIVLFVENSQTLDSEYFRLFTIPSLMYQNSTIFGNDVNLRLVSLWSSPNFRYVVFLSRVEEFIGYLVGLKKTLKIHSWGIFL